MKKKINWKELPYSEYPYINFLGKQSQRVKHIKGRMKKIDEIDKQIGKLQTERKKHKRQLFLWENDLKDINKVIEQTTKVSKSDDSISLVKGKNYIRGKIRLYGENKWVHIGSVNKKGIVNPNKLIGKMSDKELCDEFRHKLGVSVGKGKKRFFSESYMKKQKKKKSEELELKKEYRKKVKEGKQSVYTSEEGKTDSESTTTSKGYEHLRKRK